MATTAADIGSEFSNFSGNAILGGAGGGALNIDVQRPMQQLAAYTNLYNQNIWKQKQADTDAKVTELAKIANISLNDLYGKDKDRMSKDYTDLLAYASQYAAKQPKNNTEKLQQELEWQTKIGGFMNNYNSGKGRAIAFHAHENQILNNTTDPERQKVQLEQLRTAFDGTDISTPISALPQYKMEDISIPKPIPQKFSLIQVGGDNNVTTEGTVFNPALNSGNADATVLGLKKAYPQKGTPEYDNLSQGEKDAADQQATVESQGKIWADMTTPLNSAIKNYIDADGNFNAEKFENDNASNSTLMQPYNALKALNSYSQDKYNQSVNGMFQDKGLSFKLPDNIRANDFKAGFIDFTKPISPSQLVQAGIFSQYQGDNFVKKVDETGKATQVKIAGANRASMERIAAGTQAGENYRKALDLLDKGWVRGADGKMHPPAKGDTSAQNNNGVIPYWQNYILPQIQADTITKGKGEKVGRSRLNKYSFGLLGSDGEPTDLPANYTGDVPVEPDKISGLSVALLGELNDEGKAKAIVGGENPTDIKVRLDNGNPVGLVIDGVYYDQNDINSKATRLNDKTVSSKQDSNIFSTAPTPSIAPQSTEAQSPTKKGMSDEQFKNFLQKNGLK